jgi:hypothetical protein
MAELLRGDSGSRQRLGSLMRQAEALMALERLLSSRLAADLAGRFKVAAAHPDRLVLVTASATLATRLKMQANELMDALHQAGHTGIDRIEVRVAPLTEPDTGRERRQRPLSPAAKQALGVMGRLAADDED